VTFKRTLHQSDGLADIDTDSGSVEIGTHPSRIDFQSLRHRQHRLERAMGERE